MLTSAQIELINALTVEGELKSPRNAHYFTSPKEIDVLVAKALDAVDKQGQKQATITWGPPGSGKDYILGNGKGALISYDEGPADNGGIYLAPGYADTIRRVAQDYEDQMTPVSFDSFFDRMELWKDYQPIAQRIRHHMLKEALMRELSIDVSTTSSSLGNVKLITLLRDLDYKSIKMTGAYAPLDISKERVLLRPRPGDPVNDLVKKRIGALSTFKDYIGEVNQFDLYTNPSNDVEPRLAASYRDGEMVYADSEALDAMVEQVTNDRSAILGHLSDCHATPPEVVDLIKAYQDAAYQFVFTIQTTRCDIDFKNLPKAPTHES